MKDNKEHSIPHHGLKEKQKAKADAELKLLRFESLKNISQNQKIFADLISLKYSLFDYLELGVFSDNYLFSEFLKKYVAIINITKRKLAKDLSVHETNFSRLINNKENPGVALLYRIEEHSNNILPASLLWQLVTKKLLVEIDANTAEKRKQSKLVKNKLQLKTA